jgi:hypothetical protein
MELFQLLLLETLEKTLATVGQHPATTQLELELMIHHTVFHHGLIMVHVWISIRLALVFYHHGLDPIIHINMHQEQVWQHLW